MDECVRIMESFAKRFSDRNACYLLGGYTIHHDQVIGKHSQIVYRILQSQAFHHPKAVGSELYASTNFTDFEGLLDYVDLDSLAGESEGTSQPTNACTRDDHS